MSKRIAGVMTAAAAVLMMAVAGQAVEPQRGAVSGDAAIGPKEVGIPENRSHVSILAEGLTPESPIPCAPEACRGRGTIRYATNDGLEFEGQIDCVAIQGNKAFVRFLIKSGDTLQRGAAYVEDNSDPLGTEPGLADRFAIMALESGSCGDADVQAALMNEAAFIVGGDLRVTNACRVLVCAA